MTIHAKSLALGFAVACLLGVGAVVAAFFLIGPQIRTLSHDLVLPSDKPIKVTSFHFAWGVEHDERRLADDRFALEYVSTVPHTDLAAVDRETVEAFELIRATSELWALNAADVSAFPSVQRKGRYLAYVFSRNSDGRWSFERKPAKVFVND